MLKEMGKYIGAWAFIGLVIYMGYVILAGTPLARIERACLATEWAGTTVSSVASLFSSEAEARSKVAMGEFTLSCQYLVYRQFYRDDYERMKAAREAAQSEASAGEGGVETRPEGQ